MGNEFEKEDTFNNQKEEQETQQDTSSQADEEDTEEEASQKLQDFFYELQQRNKITQKFSPVFEQRNQYKGDKLRQKSDNINEYDEEEQKKILLAQQKKVIKHLVQLENSYSNLDMKDKAKEYAKIRHDFKAIANVPEVSDEVKNKIMAFNAEVAKKLGKEQQPDLDSSFDFIANIFGDTQSGETFAQIVGMYFEQLTEKVRQLPPDETTISYGTQDLLDALKKVDI